jgi:hypothetical protein
MRLTEEQIKHLENAHQFAAEALKEFRAAGLDVMTTSYVMEILPALSRARDLLQALLAQCRKA